MTQTRLNSLTLLSVEYELLRDIDLSSLIRDKGASLTCAVRLTDTACPRVALRAPRVTHSSPFLEFFLFMYKYFKQKLTNNYSYRSEKFEIYTPKNPMSTVGS